MYHAEWDTIGTEQKLNYFELELIYFFHLRFLPIGVVFEPNLWHDEIERTKGNQNEATAFDWHMTGFVTFWLPQNIQTGTT